nr:putative oxidoreductase YdgJ [Candidatus Pantoea persica]
MASSTTSNTPPVQHVAACSLGVSGTTTADGPLDFFIDRSHGMKGFILNLTIKGKGLVFDGENGFDCLPGDMLLFQPKTAHYYGRAPDSPDGHHCWVYFRPRAYWKDWLQWQDVRKGVGRLRLNETLRGEFDRLFASIEQTHNSGRRFAEELAMNLLERLLLRAVEDDPRIIEACQYVTNHLASEVKIEEVARHVCLSPSRLAHLFREQMGTICCAGRRSARHPRQAAAANHPGADRQRRA